jgi:hypothetical protein
MLQLDMNAYSRDPNSQTIYLPTNDTDAGLRRSLKDLLNTYLGGDFAEGVLTGGTSDHRAWTDQGFAAVFPFENPTDYNRNIHTVNDTTANTNNLALSERFAKLVLAFLAHHAGLTALAENGSQGNQSQDLGQDIKLASSMDDAEATTIAAASTTAVTALHICPVSDFASPGCLESAVTMSPVENRGGRQFFALAFPFELTSGMYVRFTGYDANDKAIQQRTVQLLKP